MYDSLGAFLKVAFNALIFIIDHMYIMPCYESWRRRNVCSRYMEIKFQENKFFSVKHIVSHIFQQVNSVEKNISFIQRARKSEVIFLVAIIFIQKYLECCHVGRVIIGYNSSDGKSCSSQVLQALQQFFRNPVICN